MARRHHLRRDRGEHGVELAALEGEVERELLQQVGAVGDAVAPTVSRVEAAIVAHRGQVGGRGATSSPRSASDEVRLDAIGTRDLGQGERGERLGEAGVVGRAGRQARHERRPDRLQRRRYQGARPRAQVESASMAIPSRSSGSGEARQSSRAIASAWRGPSSATFQPTCFRTWSANLVEVPGGQAAPAEASAPQPRHAPTRACLAPDEQSHADGAQRAAERRSNGARSGRLISIATNSAASSGDIARVRSNA